MNTPWLAEFHRRWQAARGRRTTAAARAFGIGWIELLEGAGVRSAEDQQTAQREAEALEKDGRIVLKRHRYRRYLIERISLPLESEDWLRGQFGSHDPAALKEESLQCLADQLARPHPLWPHEWLEFCERLTVAFAAGKNPRPFAWHRPEQLRFLLETLRGLTSREWSGTELIFENGAPHETRSLGAPYQLSFADLQRALQIGTSAARLLTVENATSFRLLAAADPDGTTLLVASSFPTPALRELLAKLPLELPHHHFGDTDPSGWLILRTLRAISPRPVLPFRMKWRPFASPAPLTARDRAMVEKLLETPEMADCHDEIAAIAAAGNRGDFEQESLGPPDRQGWPFYVLGGQ